MGIELPGEAKDGAVDFSVVAVRTPAAVADKLPAHEDVGTPVDERRRCAAQSQRGLVLRRRQTAATSMIQTTSKSKYLGDVSTTRLR